MMAKPTQQIDSGIAVKENGKITMAEFLLPEAKQETEMIRDHLGQMVREVVIRKHLGQMVREVVVDWAKEQPDVAQHPGWLLSWEQLDPRLRELDCRIGDRVARFVYDTISKE